MAGFERTVEIEGAADVVYRWMTDFGNAPRFLKGVIRIEPLDEGPLRAGWRFRETRLMGKRECSADITVTEVHGPNDGEGPYVHAATSSAAGVDATYRYVVHAVGEASTRIDLEATVIARSFLGRFMTPIMMMAIKKTDADHLNNLKTAFEADLKASVSS